jgi:hypothetical protein
MSSSTPSSQSFKLSAPQSHALFDILTHAETYHEIQLFRSPTAIQQYGPPFQSSTTKSTSPILATMVRKFMLKLPGLRDISPSFWTDKCKPLIEKLGDIELSESYDKGSIGARKTLATAVSAVLEHPARGYLGGIRKREIPRDQEWDVSKPEDVLLAWDCFVQDLIYGNRVDELFTNAVKTDKLEEHPPLVRAAHRYILVKYAFLFYSLRIWCVHLASISANRSRLVWLPSCIIRWCFLLTDLICSD